MLDFAKRMLEKLLILAFSSPLKQTAWEHKSAHGRTNTREPTPLNILRQYCFSCASAFAPKSLNSTWIRIKDHYRTIL